MAQHKCGYHLRNEKACNWDPNFLFRINTQKGIIIILLMLRLYASFHVNFSYRFFSAPFIILMVLPLDLAGPAFEISPYPEILFDVFIWEGGLTRFFQQGSR